MARPLTAQEKALINAKRFEDFKSKVDKNIDKMWEGVFDLAEESVRLSGETLEVALMGIASIPMMLFLLMAVAIILM